MKRLVLDTSVFVNPAVRDALGHSAPQAFDNFLQIASKLTNHEFYMPPSVFEELKNFLEPAQINGQMLHVIKLQAPCKLELKCPAYVLYDLVEEMRERINKGLRHAEKAVRSVCTADKPDEVIQDLRRKYRDALREGIIDSKEDVDLLLLSMQLQATLVSADKGLLKWADKLGIACLIPELFREYLDAASKVIN